MSYSYEVFEGKTLANVFKDIYTNSEENKKQIEVLMKDLLRFVTDTASAVALVPILKDYLDVAVKNDEHLIKMAAIVQRAMTRSENENTVSLLTEQEKKQLLDSVQDLEDNK